MSLDELFHKTLQYFYTLSLQELKQKLNQAKLLADCLNTVIEQKENEVSQ